ncbi:hypothetical protein BDV11DRAFT_179237 [Aspergillus similis]
MDISRASRSDRARALLLSLNWSLSFCTCTSYSNTCFLSSFFSASRFWFLVCNISISFDFCSAANFALRFALA